VTAGSSRAREAEFVLVLTVLRNQYKKDQGQKPA